MFVLPYIPGTKKLHINPDDQCEYCGANRVHFTFEEGKSPLKSKATEYSGCVLCDEDLNAKDAYDYFRAYFSAERNPNRPTTERLEAFVSKLVLAFLT